MRVSTGRATLSDGRMISVLVEGFGVGRQRTAQHRLNVPFSGLQSLMQTIAQQGGRIMEIGTVDTVATAAAAPAEAAPAPQAAAPR
ncbi:MAG: ferredoxin-NADP reductase, partial [Cyanobacteriota bacterium]